MLADELGPGALAATRRGRQAMASEHLADGQVGAAVAELEQFALDPAISQHRVLTGEAEDELVEFAPGSTTSSVRRESGWRPRPTGPHERMLFVNAGSDPSRGVGLVADHG